MFSSKQLPIFLINIAAILFISSCSGSGLSPVMPDLSTSPSIQVDMSPDTSSRMEWGLWSVAIDTGNGTVESVPLRGAMFRANVTMFLQPPAGSLSNLIFQNLDLSGWLTEGKINLDVGFAHPFPGFDEYTGFDVVGAFCHNGSNMSTYDPGVNYGKKGVDAVMLNPDGYTRWFNPSEFPQQGILGYTPGAAGTKGFIPGATISPYKYFADGIDSEETLTDFYNDPGNSNTRGYFKAGSANFRRYELQFPMDGGFPVLNFQYGVHASWEQNTLGPPWNVKDFPITANMQEPLNIAEDVSDSNLYFIDSGTYGGSFIIDIELLDHQGFQNSNGVTGEIEAVVVEAPFVPGGAVITAAPNLVPGGSSEYTSTYSIEIPDCEPSEAGEAQYLVTIISSDPTSYDSGLGAPYPDGAALASYFAGYVTIADEVGNLPPVAGTIDFYWDCDGDPCSGQIITFEISEAYDPEGQPVTVTWDFDGNFDYADDIDGDDTNLTGEYIFDTPGVYEAYCRVSDGTFDSDVGPYSVTVIDCTPDSPTVIAEVPAVNSPQNIGYDVTLNIDDGYAYIAESTGASGTLWVVDIDPPESASKHGSVDFSYLQSAIANKGAYAYIGGVYLNGISTVDCTDPDNPVVIDTYLQGLSNAFINDLDVVGDHLYAAAQWGGIMVFDITDDPPIPSFVGQTPGGFGPVVNSSTCAITPDEQWGFYADGYEINPDMDDFIKIVDLSDKSNPSVVGDVMVHYHFYSDLEVQGDYLYLHEDSYYTIFDISDLPNMPIVYSATGFGGGWSDQEISGNYAYLMKGTFGSGTLRVLDISDPANPSIFTDLTLPGGGLGGAYDCGLLYIGAGYNALDIIDLW